MVKKKLIDTLNITPAQELDILRKVVEVTNSDLDLKLILQEVVSFVNDTTRADSVFIYLKDDKEKTLTLMASKTPHKKELGNVSLNIGEGIAGWVAKESKVVAIQKNAYEDARFKEFDVLPEDKYDALLAIPIIYKTKTIGVINVQHKKPHEYPQDTIDIISIIGKQIGGSIVHAQLYEETKNKALQFDSLTKVSQSITSKDYLDEILDLIVVVTAEMLNSKICSILLLDKKGNELSMTATQSLSEAYKKKPNVKVESSVIGQVIKTRQPISIYDVCEEKSYGFRDIAVKEGFTSMLAVPMIVKDRAIGTINVYTKEHHSFSQEEINVLQMVANQAAVAVENTKLVEEALKAKEALETRKLIERAKGVLMRMLSLSEEAAYRIIHKKSMDSSKTMKEVAESILLMDEIKGL